MTDKQLAERASQAGVEVAQWAKIVGREIKRRLDLAHAHATLAVTETLRLTQPGRKTLIAASQSRSYKAALGDLDALLTRLVGPSTRSNEGLLREARSSIYIGAFRWYAVNLPAEFSVGPDEPIPDHQTQGVRGLVLHGMELRREIEAKVEGVERRLLSTLEIATREGTSSAKSADLIKGWVTQGYQSILASCEVALNDSAVAIEQIAGIDAAKPEYRPKTQL